MRRPDSTERLAAVRVARPDPATTGELGLATTGPVRPARFRAGARSELRRQLRQIARLRTATLVLTVLAIVGAPVAFFVIREAARDPVFAELDRWPLPRWAAASHQDDAYGSRWCIRTCRFRERTWQSKRQPEQTNAVYLTALRKAGWRTWDARGCRPEGVDGFLTCWQRDEYVLQLWVRAAVCEIKPIRPTIGTAAKASPSPRGSAQAPSPEPSVSLGPGCGASLATVKVFNRIAYEEAGP